MWNIHFLYDMWGSGHCQVRSSFAASQVGWFPSTYVEEEDWRHFSACSKQTTPSGCETVLPSKNPETLTRVNAAEPPHPPKPPSDPALTQSRCQITCSQSGTPCLASQQPRLPLRTHWEVLRPHHHLSLCLLFHSPRITTQEWFRLPATPMLQT